MNKTMIGMSIIAILMAITAYLQGGISMVAEGFLLGMGHLLAVFPVLIAAFAVAGLISVLLNKETVAKWLGEEAGWKGPFYGTVIGAMVPGGPFFFYPLMATLLLSGASLGTIISFSAAKTLWNIGRLPIEIAFVGIELTLIRFLITVAFPVMAGTFVNIFFPKLATTIKEDVYQLQQKNQPKNRGDSVD